jgi:hypothetical protein
MTLGSNEGFSSNPAIAAKTVFMLFGRKAAAHQASQRYYSEKVLMAELHLAILLT